MDKDLFIYSALAMLAALHPSAIAGAAVGSVFFMMSPFADTFLDKLGYTIISLGVGYAAGYGVDNSYSMLVAALTAALSVAIINTCFRIANGNKMPEGFKHLLELIRAFIK